MKDIQITSDQMNIIVAALGGFVAAAVIYRLGKIRGYCEAMQIMSIFNE